MRRYKSLSSSWQTENFTTSSSYPLNFKSLSSWENWWVSQPTSTSHFFNHFSRKSHTLFTTNGSIQERTWVKIMLRFCGVTWRTWPPTKAETNPLRTLFIKMSLDSHTSQIRRLLKRERLLPKRLSLHTNKHGTAHSRRSKAWTI